MSRGHEQHRTRQSKTACSSSSKHVISSVEEKHKGNERLSVLRQGFSGEKNGQQNCSFLRTHNVEGSERGHHLATEKSVSTSRTLLALSLDGRCDEGARSTLQRVNVDVITECEIKE